MDLNFYCPVKIITGKDCIKNNSSVFSKYGKNCIIVTGQNSAKKSGALDDVLSALNENGIEYTIFDGIEQNPSYSSCLKAAMQAKENGAEFVIGIGGGSPLDASKAIAVLAALEDTSVENLYSLDWENEPLPIIAVGTTSGTGSEVTPVAVITTPEGLKKSVLAPSLYPKVSFGDPTYTMTIPTNFTRSTALDALSHSIEAYFNRKTNDICRTFAIRSIEILIPMLEKTAQGDAQILTFEDREKLYFASIYAGFAISVSGTCFPHGMGYFLSEQYGLAHGYACAVYLKNFIEYNVSIVPDQAKEFFYKLRIDKESLVKLIKDNLCEIDIKLTDEKITELLPRFEDNKNLKKCYGNLGKEFAKEVLTDLFF